MILRSKIFKTKTAGNKDADKLLISLL